MNLPFFFFQAEDGIRDQPRSRGLGDVYKRQLESCTNENNKFFRVVSCARRSPRNRRNFFHFRDWWQRRSFRGDLPQSEWRWMEAVMSNRFLFYPPSKDRGVKFPFFVRGGRSLSPWDSPGTWKKRESWGEGRELAEKSVERKENIRCLRNLREGEGKE